MRFINLELEQQIQERKIENEKILSEMEATIITLIFLN